MDFVASAVMRQDVKTVSPAMTVVELEAAFAQHQVSGFPVLDQDKLVGVVSRSDLVRILAPTSSTTQIAYAEDEDGNDHLPHPKIADTLGDRVKTLLVKDVMTANVVKVGPDNCLHDVADLMYERRIHRIFVVEDDRLLGIITPFDFVRLYSTNRIGADARPDPTKDF